MPEVFGVRLPPAHECLTAVDFELVPNKPPPGVKLYDEEVEEIEESDEEDEDMEPAQIPAAAPTIAPQAQAQQERQQQQQPAPLAALHTPSDVDVMTPGARQEEGSDLDEEDLFGGAGADEEESGDEPMDTVPAAAPVEAATNGVKRKLVEEDDYD